MQEFQTTLLLLVFASIAIGILKINKILFSLDEKAASDEEAMYKQVKKGIDNE